MTAATRNSQSSSSFSRNLIRHGHFLPSGELGIYGRGMVFEDVRNRFDEFVTRAGADDNPRRRDSRPSSRGELWKRPDI